LNDCARGGIKDLETPLAGKIQKNFKVQVRINTEVKDTKALPMVMVIGTLMPHRKRVGETRGNKKPWGAAGGHVEPRGAATGHGGSLEAVAGRRAATEDRGDRKELQGTTRGQEGPQQTLGVARGHESRRQSILVLFVQMCFYRLLNPIYAFCSIGIFFSSHMNLIAYECLMLP
jgi:hypothetical protein